MRRTCVVEGCEKFRVGQGLCGMHYARKSRHGDPEYTERPLWGAGVEARFWSKVDAGGVCWEWTSSDDGRHGYGRFESGQAHRWAYTNLVGPIPDGLELDHLCRNRRCVNPDHLEPVSRQVNALRSNSQAARNARKTHCLRGHPYAGENLNICRRGNGKEFRQCRKCDKARRAGSARATTEVASS